VRSGFVCASLRRISTSPETFPKNSPNIFTQRGSAYRRYWGGKCDTARPRGGRFQKWQVYQRGQGTSQNGQSVQRGLKNRSGRKSPWPGGAVGTVRAGAKEIPSIQRNITVIVRVSRDWNDNHLYLRTRLSGECYTSKQTLGIPKSCRIGCWWALASWCWCLLWGWFGGAGQNAPLVE